MLCTNALFFHSLTQNVLENKEFEKKISEICKRINYISGQLFIGQRANNYSKRPKCWTQKLDLNITLIIGGKSFFFFSWQLFLSNVCEGTDLCEKRLLSSHKQAKELRFS